jgi:hypothetical protein
MYPRKSLAVGCLTIVIVALVALGLCILVAPYYTTQIWWELRAGMFWFVPLAIIGCLVIGAAYASDKGNSSLSAGLGLLASVTLLGSIGFWVGHSYLTEKSYVASVRVTSDPVPDLNVRMPFNVAEAQVRSNLGDVPGDVQQTTYLPDRNTFATPVERRGVFTGYQTLLAQSATGSGRETPSRCNFSSQADRRIGGLFSHSLERLVNDNDRFVNWDDQDVYGYCDHGTPMMVVPLKQQVGWLVVTERPAGVAVYNGATGQLTVHADGAGIPGPTYPLSLAAAQRSSVGAISGFGDWFFNRSGWELPSDTAEINSGNTSEFVLAGKSPQYVTLLTGRGSTTAISAVSTVGAQLSGDQLAPLVVHRTSPLWLAPASILDRIHADFGDVFAVQRNAQIFELAPLDGHRWVATIGLPQNLLYRVIGDGDLHDEPCLVSLTDQQIRCGPATNTNGTGPGAAIGTLGASPVAPAPANSDLHALTPAQLVDLMDRTSRELASRAGR